MALVRRRCWGGRTSFSAMPFCRERPYRYRLRKPDGFVLLTEFGHRRPPCGCRWASGGRCHHTRLLRLSDAHWRPLLSVRYWSRRHKPPPEIVCSSRPTGTMLIPARSCLRARRFSKPSMSWRRAARSQRWIARVLGQSTSRTLSPSLVRLASRLGLFRPGRVMLSTLMLLAMNGESHYRIKRTQTQHEIVASESELRPMKVFAARY